MITMVTYHIMKMIRTCSSMTKKTGHLCDSNVVHVNPLIKCGCTDCQS